MSNEYRVYLYQLDIDENGVPLTLSDSRIDRYLLSFAAIFDRVILQSSAFFKRRDLHYQLQISPDLFRIMYNKLPCISVYRSVGEESHEQYIKSRYRKLIGTSSVNPEYTAYKNNNAEKIAKQLDMNFSFMNNQRATYSTDQVFRSEASLIKPWAFPADLPNIGKVCKVIKDYASKADVFQTFYVLEQVQKKAGLNPAGINLVGHQLRYCYFQANAIANECLSVNDFHTQYKYVRQYLAVTGLDQIVNSPLVLISPQQIVCVKSQPCYRVLQKLYFILSAEDIEILYQLHQNCDKFYKKSEFQNFCAQRGLDKDIYKKAFEQMHKIVLHSKRKGRNYE